MSRPGNGAAALASGTGLPVPVLSWIAITGCGLLTALSFMKGFVYAISPNVYVYYLINYRDGLVRRGLLGQGLSWLVDQSKLDEAMAAAAVLYTATNVAALLLILAWAVIVELRRRDLLATSLYALYAASQFIATVSYDAGYLDAYDYLLLILAAIAVIRGHLLLAALLGAVGPFIHEAFIFVWLCPAVLALWQRPSLRTWLALSAPLVTTAIVYFVPTPEAGIAQMKAAPLSDEVREFVVAYQFGQTFLSSLYTVLWKIGHSFSNFLIAVVFFTLPAFLIVVLYGRERGTPGDWLALGSATVLPLSINIIGWDLTRFLAPACFFALLAVLFMESVRPARRGPRWLPVASWLGVLVLVQVPFVYGYVEVTAVEDRTLVRDWPLGRLVTSGVAYYSRKIRPRVEPVSGHEDPPGNVWYMEEDAWSGALVRRPGTNIFDATMTKGGMVETYSATIVRDGDRIFVTRNPHDEKAKMTYVGTLKGNRVSGTYSGGVWGATILR